MKLYGMTMSVRESAIACYEWTCPEGVDGQLVFLFNPAHTNCFVATNIRIECADGTKDSIVESEHEEVTLKSLVPGYPSQTVANITKGEPIALGNLPVALDSGWHVEPGDKVGFEVMNITGNMQMFSIGFRVNHVTLAEDGRQWANQDTGELVRPLTFDEKHLTTGTRYRDLVIVDPMTYEGFDSK